MLRAAILSLVLIIAGVGSASASECGKLCTHDWWNTATQREIAAEIVTVDVNARDERGYTPLHWAAFASTPAEVLALLDAGADAKAKDDMDKTPFDYAVDNKKLKGIDAYWRLNDALYD